MDLFVSTESAFSPMLLRRKNVWYSMQNGNWSDPNTWMSNAYDKRNVTSPRPGDDVYINHNVALDVIAANYVVNNLYVSGTLRETAPNGTFTVNGDLQGNGTVDLSGGSMTLNLLGYNNYIGNIISGSSGTVVYASPIYAQTILPFTYWNLILAGSKNTIRNMVTDLTVNNTLTLGGILNTNGYNILVNGATNANYSQSTINTTTNMTFIGQVSWGGGASITITGGNVEVRGGMFLNSTSGDWTNANVNFTTNNQTVTISVGLLVNNVTVTGAIAINTASGSAGPLIVNGLLNGTVAGSTFNNDGKIQFNSSTTQMTTGVFNAVHTSGSTIIYNFNGNYTLPLTTYENLQITGTGTKSPSANLTINQGLTLNAGVLDLLTYNLIVTGTTTLAGTTGALNKTGAGTMLFVGQFSTGTGAVNSNWSGGNPTVEFRGGMNLNNGAINTGTGTINFTTNNQTINTNNLQPFNASVLISAGITLTDISLVTTYNGTINGASSTSIYDCRGAVTYKNATAPMLTGKLYCNQATNTFIYGGATNQDIQVPSDPTSPGYYNLTLNGGAFAKKLLGNVSVKGTYTLTSPTTLNSNGFALTNP